MKARILLTRWGCQVKNKRRGAYRKEEAKSHVKLAVLVEVNVWNLEHFTDLTANAVVQINRGNVDILAVLILSVGGEIAKA